MCKGIEGCFGCALISHNFIITQQRYDKAVNKRVEYISYLMIAMKHSARIIKVALKIVNIKKQENFVHLNPINIIKKSLYRANFIY